MLFLNSCLCYFNVSKASMSLSSAVNARNSPGCCEKSTYFVSNTARCKQEIKTFLRENIHVGGLYTQMAYSVNTCVPSYPSFDPRCNWREKNWIEKEHLKLKLIVPRKRTKWFCLNIFMYTHAYIKQLSRKYLAALVVKSFRKNFYWNSIFS